MEDTTKIKQYIRHIVPKPYSELHLAQSLYVQQDSCTILLDGLEIECVSLRPVQDVKDSNTHPLHIIPAEDAYAIVADLSEGTLRHRPILTVYEEKKTPRHQLL